MSGKGVRRATRGLSGWQRRTKKASPAMLRLKRGEAGSFETRGSGSSESAFRRSTRNLQKNRSNSLKGMAGKLSMRDDSRLWLSRNEETNDAKNFNTSKGSSFVPNE